MPPRFDHELASGTTLRKDLVRLLRPSLVLAGLVLLAAGALRWVQGTGTSPGSLLGPDAALILGLWLAGIASLSLAAVLHRQA